jgi:16S rRNA (uracil1498-N3)-methyltransferase
MPPRIDFTSQRLFIDQSMQEGEEIALDKAQSNYLLNVLRMRQGEGLLVFNGRDGEWRAALGEVGKKSAVLVINSQTQEQPSLADLWLCFAPLKSARLDYMVQKAVEMGASRLVPVLTRRTQVSRLNLERMRANIIEAAEQCGVLAIPEAAEEMKLPKLLEAIEPTRVLIFCDEAAENADPVQALAGVRRGTPLAVLIGPEGGFDDEERAMIRVHKPSIAIALGPRILRADTAAVAALTAVQIAAGDWRG